MKYSIKFVALILLLLTACSNKPNIYIANGQGCVVDNIKIKDQIIQYLAPINNSSEVIINGWVANISQLKVPKNISISIVDGSQKYYFLGSTALSVERKDVGSAYKNQVFNESGFSLSTKIENINPGKYTIQIASEYDDENTICIPNNYREILIN